MNEKHIRKVFTIIDKVFTQPTVIAVREEKSLKIALDAPDFVKCLVEDEYQTSTMKQLIDLATEQLDKPEG